MVSFLHSHGAVLTALLASFASTEAAYGWRHIRYHPPMALGSRMLPVIRGPPLFSGAIRRVIYDVDEMFNTMLGDTNEIFYEPFSLQHMNRPRYLLQAGPALNALVQNRAKDRLAAKNAYEITQDSKQLRIVVTVPGTKTSDIDLWLEDDGRLLKISGETKRKNGGISIHSRFERSLVMLRDVDTKEISAQMDDGVLTITAPKREEAKPDVIRIDILENKKEEENEGATGKREDDISSRCKKEESQKAKPDEVGESAMTKSQVDEPALTKTELEESVTDLDAAEKE